MHAQVSQKEMTDTAIHLIFDGPFGLACEHDRILFHDGVKNHRLWLELSKFMEF